MERGRVTVEIPGNVEILGVVRIIGCYGRRARPVGSAGANLGAVEINGHVVGQQLEEAGGEWLAA